MFWLQDYYQLVCPLLLAYVAISTVAGNCTHNHLRFADRVDDTTMNTTTGRIEICLNNAWGTICRNEFGIPDAQVACNQIAGYQSEGNLHYHSQALTFMSLIFFYKGVDIITMPQMSTVAEGPIFLDRLRCDGTESSLLDCRLGLRGIGLTTCDHSADVWIKCTSKLHFLMQQFELGKS